MDEITATKGFGDIERVLMSGDLSKLSPQQRVDYYQAVCKSLGINPLTRPFDYINLNGKLTLYPKKDATDQLRKINGVSFDDVDISDVGETYVVKVKGHDKTGRTDVEIGVVSKKDMQGNAANAQMKAVTKAKRRLTLSICGLGWLDETEIETIRGAKPVVVRETGEIVETVDAQPQSEQDAIEIQVSGGDVSTRHASAFRQAQKRGLVTGDTVRVWCASDGDTPEALEGKISLINAAISAAEA